MSTASVENFETNEVLESHILNNTPENLSEQNLETNLHHSSSTIIKTCIRRGEQICFPDIERMTVLKRFPPFEKTCPETPNIQQEDPIHSGESLIKCFNFDKQQNDFELDKCIAFWKKVMERNLEPIKCTLIDSDNECAKKVPKKGEKKLKKLKKKKIAKKMENLPSKVDSFTDKDKDGELRDSLKPAEDEVQSNLFKRAFKEIQKRRLDKIRLVARNMTNPSHISNTGVLYNCEEDQTKDDMKNLDKFVFQKKKSSKQKRSNPTIQKVSFNSSQGLVNNKQPSLQSSTNKRENTNSINKPKKENADDKGEKKTISPEATDIQEQKIEHSDKIQAVSESGPVITEITEDTKKEENSANITDEGSKQNKEYQFEEATAGGVKESSDKPKYRSKTFFMAEPDEEAQSPCLSVDNKNLEPVEEESVENMVQDQPVDNKEEHKTKNQVCIEKKDKKDECKVKLNTTKDFEKKCDCGAAQCTCKYDLLNILSKYDEIPCSCGFAKCTCVPRHFVKINNEQQRLESNVMFNESVPSETSLESSEKSLNDDVHPYTLRTFASATRASRQLSRLESALFKSRRSLTHTDSCGSNIVLEPLEICECGFDDCDCKLIGRNRTICCICGCGHSTCKCRTNKLLAKKLYEIDCKFQNIYGTAATEDDNASSNNENSEPKKMNKKTLNQRVSKTDTHGIENIILQQLNNKMLEAQEEYLAKIPEVVSTGIQCCDNVKQNPVQVRKYCFICGHYDCPCQIKKKYFV